MISEINRKRPACVVGFVREHPKREHSEQSQRDALERAGVAKVYTDLALCIRQRRRGHGDVIAVKRLHLLADPKRARVKGGLRRALYDALDAIEAAGGAVLETDTQRVSSDRKQRDAMIRDAVDDLSRTRVTARKIGRPAIEWTKDQQTIMRMHWFSRKHATDRVAFAAILADGVAASMRQVRKICGKSGRAMGPKRSAE